jgi:hypothetical protein
MNLLFWGLTIGIIGKVMLGVGVLIAHSKLAHERRIDQAVLRSFRTEHILTITGIILMVAGYGMEIYFYDLVTMLTCFGEECALSASVPLSQ